MALVVAFFVSSTPLPAAARGSGLDYLNKANLDDARGPEQAAAKHFNHAERHFHKRRKAMSTRPV